MGLEGEVGRGRGETREMEREKEMGERRVDVEGGVEMEGQREEVSVRERKGGVDMKGSESG